LDEAFRNSPNDLTDDIDCWDEEAGFFDRMRAKRQKKDPSSGPPLRKSQVELQRIQDFLHFWAESRTRSGEPGGGYVATMFQQIVGATRKAYGEDSQFTELYEQLQTSLNSEFETYKQSHPLETSPSMQFFAKWLKEEPQSIQALAKLKDMAEEGRKLGTPNEELELLIRTWEHVS